MKLGKSKGLEDGDEIRWRWDAQPWGGKRREGGLSPGRNGKSYSSFLHLHEFDCYALSPYLRTDREREQVHHGNAKARREFYFSRARAQVSSDSAESDKSPEQRSMAAYIQAVLCLSYRSSWRYMIGQAG